MSFPLSNNYSLFWDEEYKSYHLIDPEGNRMGYLSNDTWFAQKVMRAFNDQLRYQKAQETIHKYKKDIDKLHEIIWGREDV